MENPELHGPQKPAFLTSFDPSILGSGSRTRLHPRSSRRLRYEAEVEVITKELGDLEVIRQRLGLSQRKICELLLVDPSAWTRWTKSGGIAPPHIFRMLEWYLMIKKEHPALSHQFYERKPSQDFLRKDPSPDFQQQIEGLEAKVRRWQRFTIAATALMALLACVFYVISKYNQPSLG